jgi:predicted RNA-binding Zn-ribbon protein involved in translation (DUF1610 family)
VSVAADLAAACDALVEHNEAAVLHEDPALLELVHQSRRFLRVARGDLGPPARELLEGLSGAVAAIRKRPVAIAAHVYRAVLAAEQVVVSALKLPRERSTSVTTEVTVAREKGYNGRACPECGQFTVRYKGKCESCDSCSWTGGCS